MPLQLPCERCQKAPATVHVTEIPDPDGSGGAEQEIDQQHLCQTCAAAIVPKAALPPKGGMDLWKLMLSGQKQLRPRRSSPQCGNCKTSLDEIRRRGKVGCAACYESFKEYFEELLERMHGATTHVGRLPGLGQRELERMRRIDGLKQELERAIREENYEHAAGLRDELKTLETEPEPERGG